MAAIDDNVHQPPIPALGRNRLMQFELGRTFDIAVLISRSKSQVDDIFIGRIVRIRFQINDAFQYFIGTGSGDVRQIRYLIPLLHFNTDDFRGQRLDEQEREQKKDRYQYFHHSPFHSLYGLIHILVTDLNAESVIMNLVNSNIKVGCRMLRYITVTRLAALLEGEESIEVRVRNMK